MARGKAVKKDSLSVEERLEQALVPDWEQPYKVPENWIWTKFSTLKYRSTDFFDGDWILSENMDSKGNVRLLQLSDIGIGEFLNKSTKFISTDTFRKLNCSEIFEGDILVSRMAEPIARSCIVPKLNNVLITAVDVAVLRCNQSVAKNKYINYLCNASWFTELANKLARGTTRVRITRRNLGDMPIPLPPLAEQQRIVDRIESLFAKLDEAKEKAQAALDSFENRKAAILHQAFTGELTTKWREENGEGLDRWEKLTLQDVCSQKITDGTHQTPTYSDEKNGVPFISAKDVTSGEIDWSKIKYITKDLHELLYKRVAPQIDDVLLAKNGTTGVAAIVKADKIFDIYVTLALLRPNRERILPRYLYHIVNSPICKEQFNSHLTGIGVPNLHLRDIKEVKINIPTIPEQTEIVRILDSVFEKEQQAKELAGVIEKIDLMKKAILARAFRGELGTNDSKEESAIELLKEILEVKS